MKRRIFSPREIILPKAKLARSAISWGKFVMPILLLAWFFVLAAPVRAEETVTWILKSPMPTARSGPATGVIDGKIYAAGGSTASGQALANLEAYDPKSDSWEVKPSMSAPRWGLASGIIDGKYYVVMGGSPVPYGSVKTEEYDPATNQWILKSDMPNPGWGVAAGVINNKLYVVGGYNWPNWGMNFNREYNPATNQWTLKAPMPTKRSWLAAEVIDNKFYAVGGWNWNDTADLPTLEVYDPASDSWTAKANLPVGLRNIATATLGGKLYVFGGLTGEGASTKFYASVYVYDPLTDAWTRLADLPQAIAGAAAEEFEGNIYLIGGSTATASLNTTYFWQIEKQINPVILVPGVMGSWNISGRWQIDPIFHTYDNLMEALIVAGYKESSLMEDKPTLFTFPYDWRQDNNITAGLLKEKIQQVKAITGSNKVDIIAHSMGGLVARSYIEGSNYQNDIDQAIFLGTPHLGSPESYLKYGGGDGFFTTGEKLAKYLFQVEAAFNGYFDLTDYIRAKVLTVEQLLPTFDYLKDKLPDNVWQLRPYPLNYPQNNYLENLNSQAVVDLLKQRVKITNIVSNLGLNSTLNYLKVIADPNTTDNKWQSGYPENLGQTLDSLEMGSGDDTVPLISAAGLNGVETIASVSADHTNLPTIMQKEIIKALTGQEPTDYFNSKITATIKRWAFFRVYSPVDFAVIAPDGRKIGKDFASSTEINEIPDAFYSGFGGHEEFVLIPNPADGEYKVELQGVDNGGEYTLVNSIINDNEEVSREFSGNIAPEQERDFNITYSAAAENPISELAPIDTVPPVVIINKPVEADKYLYSDNLVIDYTATDDFSGIATTTIILDGQEIASTSINLFDYSLGQHSLIVQAVDKAGNQSQAQANFTIIDTVPPVVIINKPTAGEKYLHSENLVIDYSATDEFAGIATTTLTIDGREVATTTVDLFNYSLGMHNLIVTAIDKAGNQAVKQVKFEIITNIDSTISDINRIRELGWLKDKIYYELLKDALKLLKIEAKYFNQEQELNEKLIRKTRDDWKLTDKQKQKLIEQYNKKLAELKKNRAKAINKSLDLIIKLLNKAKDKNRINQAGYDIIINDINYLRENL